MRGVLLVAGALIVAGLIVQPIVNRLRPRHSEALRLARRVLVQAAAALALGWVAFGLAREGGTLLIGLAILCTILAAFAVFMGALFVWGFVQQPPREDE